MSVRLPFALASRFVAAETLEGALPKVYALNHKGITVTMDILGEYVADRSVAVTARDNYINLIHTVAAECRKGMQANISIKLSMLGQKIDTEFCLENLHKLLSVAKEEDIFIRLDMEGSDLTQSTLDLFEAVYPQYPDHVGIVLQSMLKRTDKDVKRMCEINARVRLVKGAYKESPSVAYQKMDEIREHFIQQMKMLITEGRYPAIATHDDRLIRATKAFVREQNIPNDRFEFQMLYGMRPETQIELAEQGYNVRVYVPYGTEWFPYYSRRLRERKENVWFVVTNLFRK